MDRTLVRIGAFLSFLAVAIGAFGRHSLEPHLDAKSIEVFDIAARYHAIHALGVVAIGIIAGHVRARNLRLAGWLLIAGVIIFAGSLYALALSGVKILGAVAPLGGLCLMGGWLTLAFGLTDKSAATEGGASDR